ncbi:MAG: hypothetical protein HRF40_09910 [Nitrososphaera sp.]|jgi:hypothetical protein
MQNPSDSIDDDLLPAEKIAFIAYNVGVFESVQKFGSLIIAGKIEGGMDPANVAELLENAHAFYDSEMIAQLVNGMLRQSGNTTIGRVTAGQVENVIRQLKAAGVRLG